MNFGGERRRSPLVNVTPLIDALFLLLIFFMVSSTFRDLPGIPLDLPEAKTGEATRSTGVEIQIDREGVIRHVEENVETTTHGEQIVRTLTELGFPRAPEAPADEGDAATPPP